ncbi:MAG: hypothetical protein RIB45_07175 [Marivibrio sp.]|uniref:hypothetical protein n=1 Tax=Marivibrio sp. TaxID=2039719 RepID=UPI0032F0985D
MLASPEPTTTWRRREAAALASLEALEAYTTTDAAKRVVRVYRRLLTQNGGRLPRKIGFDPTEIGRDLANAVLYDVRDPARVVFRIAGETIKEHFRTNPVGRCYLEFVPEERRSHALAAFRACAETPCAMLARTRQVFASGVWRYCEAVGLPLLAEDATAPATHLLFVDTPLAHPSPSDYDTASFQCAHLIERRFADLGFGTPNGFVDLVSPDPDGPFA